MKKDLFKAINTANENFASFDRDGATAFAGENFSNEMNAVNTAEVSLPYVFTLDNTTASTITDVVFLNAVKGVGTTNNGVTAGVTVTYDVTDWTYLSFLYYLLGGENVYIQQLYLECSVQAQLTKIITVKFQDPSGESRETPIVPRIDPKNNQTTVLVVDCGFWLNKTTKVTIASLQTAALTISMYPAIKGNQIGAIKGTGNATVLKDPSLERPLIVKA